MIKDFDISESNSSDFKVVCEIVKSHIASMIPNASSGGVQTFYPPEEWQEKYGRESIAVIVHDGGDAAPFFNYDYQKYDLIEGMQAALRERGFFAEQCTSWYSAIYEI